MATVKKTKLPVTEVTPEMITKAASTTFMKNLLNLASSISRAAINGPFNTDLPILAASWITEKSAYRRVNIPASTSVNVKEIIISKRGGLIFRFEVMGGLKRNVGETVEFYEINWSDVINTLGDFADRVDANHDPCFALEIVDGQLRDAIKKNPAMHQVLSEGFALALSASRDKAMDEGIKNLPYFGSF